jgi:hypothetical protein
MLVGMRRRLLGLAVLFAGLAILAGWYALARFGAPEASWPLPVAAPGERALALRWVRFDGTCDASGAVPVDARHFALADDEDNVIRVYDAEQGGKPLRHTNLSKQIERLRPDAESDIEAATVLGTRAYWLSSQARTKRGRRDPDRMLLITTDIPNLQAKVEVQGHVYRGLLTDLLASAELAPYHLADAAELAAKEPGALNLEGLTATPEGTLLLGFRSPVPNGSALLVTIVNPDDLETQGPLRFGTPIELDLKGLGVRALSHWHDTYWIAAGASGKAGAARLYRWRGPGYAAELIADGLLRNLNPEAFFSEESNTELLLLSDDGSQRVNGRRCKKLAHKRRKSFRGLWLRVTDSGATAGDAATDEH